MRSGLSSIGMRPRINTFDDKRKAPESQTGVVPLSLQTYGKLGATS